MSLFQQPAKKDILLACLSGILIIVSAPKLELTGCIWFAFVPLFFALREKTPRQAFWIGFVLGAIVSLGGAYWVVHTLQEFGHLSLWLAIPIFLIFCTFYNFHFAIFTYILKRFPLSLPFIFWIPILFTAIEYLFPQIFSWHLGAVLYKKLWLIQTAELTGVYGMTFLIVLVNTFIFELILWIKKETDIFPKYACIITLTLMLFSSAYSYFQLSRYHELLKNAPKIRAALIQTNIGNLEKLQASKGYSGAVRHTQATNEQLVLKAAKTPGLDLIVLPETAVPGYFTTDYPANQTEIFELASKADIPLVFGGYDKTDENPFRAYNSIFLISPHFQVLGRYNKTHLLAFGEYLPLSQWFPAMKQWVPQISDFAHGTQPEVLSLTKELRFAPLICLEAIFPSFVRKFVKQGAQFIITVTNDSWFGDTSSPYQHRMLHVWRAIENRTPMLRVANTGITTFIDLTGKIRSETPLFQEKILIDEVGIIQNQTLYTKYGDVVAYVIIAMLILLYVLFYDARQSIKMS